MLTGKVMLNSVQMQMQMQICESRLVESRLRLSPFPALSYLQTYADCHCPVMIVLNPPNHSSPKIYPSIDSDHQGGGRDAEELRDPPQHEQVRRRV